MKKIRSISILLFALIAIHSIGYGQNWYMDKAEEDNHKGAYVDALVIFEEVIRKGYANEKILKKTADALYFQGEYRKAYPRYRVLFRQYKDNLDAVYFLRYMHSLKSVNRYTEADQLMQEYAEKFPDQDQAESFALNQNYLEAIKAKKDDYEIGVTAINSLEADFAPSYYKNKVVFTSARDTGNFVKHRHKWNESPFTKLYIAEMNSRTKELSQVKQFAENINTSDYHESSTAFTKDGKTMYFTRNNYLNKTKRTNQQGVQLLKIYRAYLKDGTWQKEEELPFNSDAYNTAHPALSPDEKTLYFVSDRPGSIGTSDIWKVEIKDNGSFGEAENLGNTINTTARESFPFIAADSLMYFASNGHQGLGGLDIFVAKADSLGNYTQVQNIGAAINSRFDDFGFIIDSEGNGFFSTNRNVGRFKKDNIYRLKQRFQPDFDERIKKKIEIVDEQTKKTIAEVDVRLFNKDYTEIDIKRADEVGKLVIHQPEEEESLYLRFEREGYEVKELNFTFENFLNQEVLQVNLRKRLQEIKKGEDLARILQIDEIYFDLDKYNIREDASVELAKVLQILNAYPDISIEIGSHTDSRASFEYNITLSQNRAEATKNWLIEKGISAERISAKGYGETQLVNHCKDGVECTEEEHQQNRRSEFIIVEMKD